MRLITLSRALQEQRHCSKQITQEPQSLLGENFSLQSSASNCKNLQEKKNRKMLFFMEYRARLHLHTVTQVMHWVCQVHRCIPWFHSLMKQQLVPETRQYQSARWAVYCTTSAGCISTEVLHTNYTSHFIATAKFEDPSDRS